MGTATMCRRSRRRVSNAVRNQYGQFMTPTSSNSADANIPAEGRASRVLARSLMVGDTLILPGVGKRRIRMIDTFQGDYASWDSFPSIMVTFVNNDKTGLRAWSIDPERRVTIWETPRRRRLRRNASRAQTNSFFNYYR